MALKKTNKIALLIGRFQPFHKGHLEVIKKIAKKYRRVIIGIGSAQHSHTITNPFTAGERYRMIEASLQAARIKNFIIIPIDDLDRHSLWVQHVISIMPPFDVVYTNEPLTKRLFLEQNIQVRNIQFFKRPAYSATNIRRVMIEGKGEEWTKLVPKAVANIIKEINGVKRLKELAITDK